MKPRTASATSYGVRPPRLSLGVEFYLTFQIDVSCGQDSFIKVRIQSSHGHIEFWMIRYNLIWRLSLKNQGRDDHIFLMQFVSGHVYTGPGL